MNLNLFRLFIPLIILIFVDIFNPLLSEDFQKERELEYIIEEDIFNRKNTKISVKSNGIGKSLKEAKEDAVINAISKVVGTYFDSNSKIKLKKVFDEEKTNKFKEISKEYFTYNRGNIYSFEVIKIENINEIYYIQALVDVITENIEDYIEEFTAGESIIDVEINTIKDSIDKYKKQRTNLLSNLLERKNDLEYQYISHGKGQLLESFSFLIYCQNTLKDNKDFCEIFKENFDLDKDCFLECIYSDRESIINEMEKYRTLKNVRNPHNILVLPFKISMRDDYKKIYNNLFEEISLAKKTIKYSDKNLIQISKNTIDFLDNNFKDKKDRLLIFNNLKEGELTNFYIENNIKNIDLYNQFFSAIDYQDPRLVLLIKDKFKNIKKTIFFDSSTSVNTSLGICGVNKLLDNFLVSDCEPSDINEAKIISLLNDLPISRTDELSLINSINSGYFNYSPLVVSSEKHFLLLLNLSKFELNKDDSISLQLRSEKDNYIDRNSAYKFNQQGNQEIKKQRALELEEQNQKKSKLEEKNREELELEEKNAKELRKVIIQTRYYDNGRYEGEFLNGKRHGKGTYFWKNGNKYIGDWRDGQRSGKGTFLYINGDKYIGEYFNNQRHGEGTYIWGRGKWEGDKYTGKWRDGKFHGQGTYFYNDGTRYIGQWINDERNGQGTYFYPDGRTEIKNY